MGEGGGVGGRGTVQSYLLIQDRRKNLFAQGASLLLSTIFGTLKPDSRSFPRVAYTLRVLTQY